MNGANDFVFFARRGELVSNRSEDHEVSMLSLHLLQNCMVCDHLERSKDALEDRLNELVCQGQLDPATAQRDIADNWIAAYKKYFHTNRPMGTSE